ncbi:hypothetical protein BH09VER1_BH09VER1_12830 [soil metagenome]
MNWRRVLMALPIGTFTLQAASEIAEIDRPAFEAFLGHTKDDLAKLDAEHFKAIAVPEDLCWQDLPKIDEALTAYELTSDETYLRSATSALKAMIATLQPGPDGRLGWWGKPLASLADPAKPNQRVREIQTDFRFAAVVSRWIALADAEPKIRDEFKEQRDRWLALTEKDIVGYWDTEGYYKDLGARGGIYQWNRDYKPNVAQITLPHEKLSMMVGGLLGLYQVTGRREYAVRAAKIGLWLKCCLGLKDGRYSWSRWTPAGTWDIDPANPAKWKTWVGAEPRAQWYEASVDTAAHLHQLGLVFTDEDMRRFAATQTEVCWNGDEAVPQYFQVDGKPAWQGEKFIALSLTPFSRKFSDFVYGPAGSAERLKVADNPWKGGVLAGWWFRGKYLPARASEVKIDLAADKVAPVTGPGFSTPPTPAEAHFARAD